MNRICLQKLITLFCIGCLMTSCGDESGNVSAQQNVTQEDQSNLRKSIVERIKQPAGLNINQRVELYFDLKADSLDSYTFENEDEMTMYGYLNLWEGRTDDALVVFQLIADEFPESSNAYDSLGEAYLAKGDSARSLELYQKSLSMDPDNFGAEDQIRRIQEPGWELPTPEEKFALVFSPEEYRDDLDQLGHRILEVHPNALKFISQDDFWAAIEQKKNLITDETTYAEFAWHCSEIVANVNCSHTSTGRFYPEHQMLPLERRFPVLVRLVDGHLYIIDPLDNKKHVKVRDEIVSINGRSVQEIIDAIYPHIPSQGYVETSKRLEFNRWATGMIPYALDLPEQFEIEIAGNPKPIVLRKAIEVKDPVEDYSLPFCRGNLCLEMLDDSATAVMTIASFNYYPWNNLPEFQEFIDSSFSAIREQEIQNLIIDVRFNGGGSQESSIYLLQHLIDEPFTYSARAEFEGKTQETEGERVSYPADYVFDGNVYFIIDGWGNSTTGHFMSIAKVKNLGTIVGEELGSNQFCSAGQKVCRLSNTKLVYYLANNTHVSMATELPDEVGILPDHNVVQSIDDYLANKDAVMEYTLELIEEKSNQ